MRIPVMAGSAMTGGGSTECISFVLDLTARKEAERGRRDAERRAARMVESATVGMWMLDAEGRTSFMNARMAKILGIELADTHAMPVAQLFLPTDRAEIEEQLAHRKAGLANAYERRFRRPDGSVAVLSVEAARSTMQKGGTRVSSAL